MECGSIHANIERRLKNRDINVPGDYVAKCTQARKSPRPYSVKYIDHKFFKDYCKNLVYKLIQPVKLASDPKITDIGNLGDSVDGMSYKLDFNYEYCTLPVRNFVQASKSEQCHFPNLYQERLKINRTKLSFARNKEHFS